MTGPAVPAPRPDARVSLRLRLTLLIGFLLFDGGLILLSLAWIFTDLGTLSLLEGLGAILMITVGGMLGGYALTGQALRPLHRVTATARRLSEQTLDQRIGHTGPHDEVAELAATFDAMLDRLAASFDAQRRFVANASHELRTPLAVMRTEIDVTLADPDADTAELRRMAGVVREASQRANALIESLLVLARSQGQRGQLARTADVDLADEAVAALAAMRYEVDRVQVDVRTDLAAAPVHGDPDLLHRLAGNLVENAVRYNHLHGRLSVRTGVADGQAFLAVANTGFEVPERDVPALFEPFRRGGRERTGARGSGLGLSIVRAVADAHRGSVDVTAHPAPDGGLTVTVRLPAR